MIIYKYVLDFSGGSRSRIELPGGWKPLSIQHQHNQICLWAMVNEANPIVQEEFAIIGTGWPLPDSMATAQHLATLVTASGALVWHIFHVKNS